jgi:hypothetical protein
MQRAIQFELWIHTAWRLSCTLISILHWLLLPWPVWHRSLKLCLNILFAMFLLLCHCTVICKQNRAVWPSCSQIWVQELSHGAFNHCKCRDEWSNLTISSLESGQSRYVAILVHKLLFTAIWCRKVFISYLFLLWSRSRHRALFQIRYLNGDKLMRLYPGIKAYVLTRVPFQHKWWI